MMCQLQVKFKQGALNITHSSHYLNKLNLCISFYRLQFNKSKVSEVPSTTVCLNNFKTARDDEWHIIALLSYNPFTSFNYAHLQPILWTLNLHKQS